LLLTIGVLVKKIIVERRQQKEQKKYLADNLKLIKAKRFRERKTIIPHPIIFLGDSQTEFFAINEFFNNSKILNRGIAGDETTNILNRLQEVTDRDPQKVFLEIGWNDLFAKNVLVDSCVKNVELILSRLKMNSPKTIIYMESMFPSSRISLNKKPMINEIIQYNAMLKNYCKQNNIIFIDVFSSLVKGKALNPLYDRGDQVHLNEEGYRVWRDQLLKYL